MQKKNKNRNCFGFPSRYVRKQDCLFHIIPAPYEASVSYGEGTSRGPAAIMTAARQVEPFDGISFPCNAGIFCDDPVPVRGRSPEIALGNIEKRVMSVIKDRRIPVMLGGEHTATLGVVRALKKTCSRFGVVHFDAHDDLRDSYRGSRYSHACIMRRVLDLGVPVFQIGIRSYCEQSREIRKHFKVGHLDAAAIAERGIPRTILPPGFPGNIYISFDVDGLDSSLVPATGTPEPGGLMWFDAVKALRTVIRKRRLIGFDVVELAPIPRFHSSDYAAARLVYEIMGLSLREGLPPLTINH